MWQGFGAMGWWQGVGWPQWRHHHHHQEAEAEDPEQGFAGAREGADGGEAGS